MLCAIKEGAHSTARRTVSLGMAVTWARIPRWTPHGRKRLQALTGALQSPSLDMSHPMTPPTPATQPVSPAPASAPAPPPPIHLPERVRLLADITQNMWWSWQLDARELFHRIDHRLWEGTRHNAVEFLRQVAPDRLEHRAKDPAFLERYDQVVRRYGLLAQRDDTWFASRYPDLLNRSIAYFSAEFALHRSLP